LLPCGVIQPNDKRPDRNRRGTSHIQPKTSVKDFDLAIWRSFSGKPRKPRLDASLLGR
jgi:hypothetical protein